MNGVIIFALGIVVILVLALRSDNRNRKKRDAEAAQRKLDLEKNFLLEMDKPKWRIGFRTNDGVDHHTKFMNPVTNRYLDERIVPSRELAVRSMEIFLKRGYMADSEDRTYPIHNVEKAWVESDDGMFDE